MVCYKQNKFQLENQSTKSYKKIASAYALNLFPALSFTLPIAAQPGIFLSQELSQDQSAMAISTAIRELQSTLKSSYNAIYPVTNKQSKDVYNQLGFLFKPTMQDAIIEIDWDS